MFLYIVCIVLTVTTLFHHRNVTATQEQSHMTWASVIRWDQSEINAIVNTMFIGFGQDPVELEAVYKQRAFRWTTSGAGAGALPETTCLDRIVCIFDCLDSLLVASCSILSHMYDKVSRRIVKQLLVCKSLQNWTVPTCKLSNGSSRGDPRGRTVMSCMISNAILEVFVQDMMRYYDHMM